MVRALDKVRARDKARGESNQWFKGGMIVQHACPGDLTRALSGKYYSPGDFGLRQMSGKAGVDTGSPRRARQTLAGET